MDTKKTSGQREPSFWMLVGSEHMGSLSPCACEQGEQAEHSSTWTMQVLQSCAQSPFIDGVLLLAGKAAETARSLEASQSMGIPIPIRVLTADRNHAKTLARVVDEIPTCDILLVHEACAPISPRDLAQFCQRASQHPALITTEESRFGGALVGDATISALIPEAHTLASPQAYALPLLRELLSHLAANDMGDWRPAQEPLALAIPRALLALKIPLCTVPLRPKVATLPCQGRGARLLIGQGYDVHRYGGSRPLVLGGIPIATDLTVSAHSDGDVLLHALMDALLGAAALGDIGQHFPPSDPRFDGISSTILLQEVLSLLTQRGIRVQHVDATIIAQKPTISPYRERIRKALAHALLLPSDAVNIKATTEEKLGFTGRVEGIKAMAIVLCRTEASTEVS